MRIAFAGTPAFGAWVLSDLLERGWTPALVLTQPDRRAGRGRRLAPPPVAILAAERGLPYLQPETINAPEVADRLRAEGVDALVVAAFGQLLRPALLDAVLCLNVHASLLPAWRGAAPIVRSLLAGEPMAGVSIMRMTPGLDEGPWALQVSRSVGLEEDAGTLGRSLAMLGALGVDRTLLAMEDGTAQWTEQSGESTYAGKLSAAERLLDPEEGVRRCHDRVRAFSPEVGAELSLGDLPIKVWRSWPWTPGEEGLPAEAAPREPGAVLRSSSPAAGGAARDRLFVACGDGLLELLRVQPTGKRAMAVPEFLRGYGRTIGERVAPRGGEAA